MDHILQHKLTKKNLSSFYFQITSFIFRGVEVVFFIDDGVKPPNGRVLVKHVNKYTVHTKYSVHSHFKIVDIFVNKINVVKFLLQCYVTLKKLVVLHFRFSEYKYFVPTGIRFNILSVSR